MTTMHPPGARAAWKDRHAWIVASLISTGVISTGVLIAASQVAVAEEPVTAVYKAYELSFQYRSTKYFYSCYELAQRTAEILRAIGARDDVKVDARNCDTTAISEDRFSDPSSRGSVFGSSRVDPYDPWNRDDRSSTFGRQESEPEQAARIRVQLMFPVEVTPKVLDELEKDKSRRALVSRVTRDPTVAMNDPIVFAAQRQEVPLSHQTVRLKPEDCGLLEEMSRQVFRKLDVRVVRKSFNCNPRMSSNIAPQLTVEALVPTGQLLPMPAQESKQAPAAEPATVEKTAVEQETAEQTGSQQQPAPAEPAPQ